MKDNILSEFLMQEANACKDWIKHSDRHSFERFYIKVLSNLRQIGISTLDTSSFYAIPLEKRLEELDRLEREHRLELEAAFLAVWLSNEMKPIREQYRKKSTLNLLQNL